MQHDFIAQRAIVLDNGIGQNTAAFAQYGIRADIGICADFAACRHFGACLDNGGRMYAALSFDNRREQSCHFGKIKIRVGSHNQVAACKFVCGFRRHNHCACPAVVHFGFVFRVGQKADVFRLRLIQRTDGGNGDVFAFPFAAELGNDLGQGVCL